MREHGNVIVAYIIQHAASASGAIVLPGHSRWHALRVAPMTEPKVERDLDGIATAAFHPVKGRWETRKGQRVEVVERLAPGFVFAQFAGYVMWHRLREVIPAVREVIRFRLSGEPAWLHPDDIARLRLMAAIDHEAERRRIEAERISPGDMVALMEGPFSGQQVEVLSIGKGRAAFAIRMFGADDLPASAPLSAMVRAAE